MCNKIYINQQFFRRCAMKKKIWDLYAPIYEKAMRADRKCYKFMYHRVKSQIVGKEVLEIATGPGLLAKHVAPAAKRRSKERKISRKSGF